MTTRNDDFDDRGLLKDGRTFRVGMTMRDGQDDERVVIVDGFGNGGIALHRPGARHAVLAAAGSTDAGADTDAGAGSAAADTKDADPREAVYLQHDADEARRWQGQGREVPVKSATGDAVQDAYLDRDESDANAWRGA
jgi:hypothetical protein